MWICSKTFVTEHPLKVIKFVIRMFGLFSWSLLENLVGMFGQERSLSSDVVTVKRFTKPSSGFRNHLKIGQSTLNFS